MAPTAPPADRAARPLRLAALTLVAGIALALVPAGPASAHPLGNFTVNTADRLVVTSHGVDLLHVIDLAEIPTVQLRAEADTNGDGVVSAQELTRYAGLECRRTAAALALVVDDHAAPLTLASATGQSRAGQAGLSTTRLECAFTSAPRATNLVQLTDSTAQNRVGWKEITAVDVCGSLLHADVPATSVSALLTAYPADELRSPLDVRTARLQVSRSGPCPDAVSGPTTKAAAAVLPRGADRLTSAFTGFVGRDHLSWPVALLAVLLSVVFGAAHALAPGHGKTVIAAYLVGQRGTRRQAFWLGGTVTLAHTASVLALGAVLSLGSLAAPERIIPASEVLSGALLAGLGGWLLWGALRRLRPGSPRTTTDHQHDHQHHDRHHPGAAAGPRRSRRTAASVSTPSPTTSRAPVGGQQVAVLAAPHPHPHPHTHEHGPGHRHDPEPTHGHLHAAALLVPQQQAPSAPLVADTHSHGGRSHSHAPLDDRPLGWRSLAAMGVAGGLVPSPSALVVLLGATALGRAAFGVLLVIGYGAGMALTLTAAGLLLLRAQSAAARRGWRADGKIARVTTVLPVLTAAVVVLVGAVLVARGFASGLLF